jgi:hypothetical protein
MVQSLSKPPLTPSSMLSGGSVDAAQKSALEMSPAGSPGAAPDTNPSQVGEQHTPEPMSTTDGYDREVMEPAGAKQASLPARHPQSGRFVSVGTTVKGADGQWRLTSTAGS